MRHLRPRKRKNNIKITLGAHFSALCNALARSIDRLGVPICYFKRHHRIVSSSSTNATVSSTQTPPSHRHKRHRLIDTNATVLTATRTFTSWPLGTTKGVTRKTLCAPATTSVTYGSQHLGCTATSNARQTIIIGGETPLPSDTICDP